MKISNSMQRRIGVILQYLQMGLSTIISLIYTPIMLKILGQNEYGIYNIASSTIAYLSLLSLGFGASYVRYYSIYKQKSDDNKVKELNGLYILVFSIIGVIALACGLFLTQHVHWFFNNTYTVSEILIAKKLMFLLTFNLAVSFTASVFVSYITSQEKFIFQKIINMVSTICSPIANVVLLYTGYGSVGMVLSSTVISITVACINIYYCFFKLGMKVNLKRLDFWLLRDIFVFSIFIAINQLVDQLNFQTDKIILGKVVGGASVAIYAVGSNLNNMFVSITAAVSNVFAPKINMIISRHDKNMDEEINSIFTKVGRIQWYLGILIVSGFVFFGKYFTFIWAGEGYENAYYVALLLMIPMAFVSSQSIGIEVQRAKNKHKARSIVYLVMAILNVIMSIYLASVWGEIGSAFGTTISIVLCPIIFMNYYYQKHIGIDIKNYWKNIISTIPSFIFPFIFGFIAERYIRITSTFIFLTLVLCYSVLYIISIYRYSFNEYEKNMSRNVIHKFKK